MFFKSCNCNSSIATRIGFAVSSYAVMHHLTFAKLDTLDYLLPEFYSGLVDEERHNDKTD